MSLNEGSLCVTSENCKLPLRVYAICQNTTEYAGLVCPDGNGCRLDYICRSNPERVLVTLGRLDDKHEIICEFELCEAPVLKSHNSEGQTEKFIFSHPATTDCVKYHGHYFSFDVSCGHVLAFPSDFFMHPLLHLVPFAYWYPVNFGNEHTGYYLIGISEQDKPFFVDEKVLTEIGQNSKIYKE